MTQARDLRRSAVSGLVFGIVGVLPVLPVVGSLAALAIGTSVRRRTTEPGTRRLALSALVLGWAGILLYGVAIAWYVA